MLLLDEPLSALDAKIRVSLREEIRAVQRELGITTVYVTHDQEEALSMSDRIVVMNEGRVEQMGTPFEIYNRPRTRFVASFVGTLNILKATGGRRLQRGASRSTARRSRRGDGPCPAPRRGEACSLALRPRPSCSTSRRGGRNQLNGTIEEVSFLGSVVRIRVRVQENIISIDTFNNPGMSLPERGQPVTVSFARDDLLVLDESAGKAA